VQKYDALAKQKQDLIAQFKKVAKDSPTYDADKAFNKQINAQLKELTKEIEPLSDDYYKAKGMLGQMAEQERVAKLTPQEYAFGLEPETEEQKKALEPELYEQQIATPPKPPVQLTPRQQVAEYGNQRIALANDQMNTAASYAPKYKSEAIKDYVDYLMQDFASAQQLVQTRPTLEGLPMTKDNKPLLRSEEIYDSLKTRIAAEAKTAMQQRTQEQALDQQKLTTPKDQFALLRESEEQVEEQKRTAEPNFDYLDPMFEKALSGQSAVKVK
jgi:bacterioferritin (cytochrome b1)